MLNNQGQAATQVKLLAAVSAADTAAATSAWVDVTKAEGDLVFNVNTGIVTGQVVWTIEHATDDQGAGGAGITPNEGAFTTVTTSNDPLSQKRTVSASAVAGFVRVVGTVTTGPVLCAVDLFYHPKNV